MIGVAFAQTCESAGLHMQSAGDNQPVRIHGHPIAGSFGNPGFDFLAELFAAAPLIFEYIFLISLCCNIFITLAFF
jgi:hypothetical protein